MPPPPPPTTDKDKGNPGHSKKNGPKGEPRHQSGDSHTTGGSSKGDTRPHARGGLASRGKGKGGVGKNRPRKIKYIRRPPQGADMTLPQPLFQQMFAVQTKLTGPHHQKIRDSYGMTLSNPEFMERFLEVWMEHIEGFGKRMKTKRDLSENEKNMEWRKRLQEKEKADFDQRRSLLSYSSALSNKELGSLAKTGQKQEMAELAAQAQAQYRALKAAQRAKDGGKKFKKGPAKRDYLRL